MPDLLTGRPGIVITVRCRLASLRYVVVFPPSCRRIESDVGLGSPRTTGMPPLPPTLWAMNQISGIAPRSTMLLTVSSSVRFSPNRFGLPPCPCQSEPPVTSRWWREAISSRRRRCWGGLPRCHTSSPSSPASISCPIWSSDSSTALRLGSPACAMTLTPPACLTARTTSAASGDGVGM